ncbi:MAG: PQQ-binding-like beta-propeller repeat protein [Planctomycetes bacterium]|nr:PQQ-binding-like beta-propeller repeat protein [Planctomycetota bacterium]
MRRIARLFTCLAVVFSMSQGQAEEWTRFRGPNGSAVSDARNLPEKWDDSTNLQWKTLLPGPGSSSPIIVGDRVFVTCYSGYGAPSTGSDPRKLLRHLICVSRTDGKILWDQPTSAAEREDSYQGFLRDHGYATSTPASDGKHVYVFYGKSGVLAYDLDGKQLWQTSVGTGSAKNNWGSGSSPVLFGNVVIVNAAAESKAVIALDKQTGKEAWHSNAPNIYGSWSTPVLVDAPGGKIELVLSAPYELWGFDPNNGDFLWFADGIADDTICGSVVARDGIVYAVGGRGGSAVAVRSGGKDDATKTHTIWKKQLSSYVPSPVLIGDRIFSVNERGVLGCLGANDGDSLLQKRLPDAGGVYASPVAADDKLYIVTRRNGTMVLSTSSSGDVLSTNKFDDDSDFNASPAIADGQILLRSNRYLYSVGTVKK